MRNGKILVTGGAGFIGSHLVDALTSKGYEATILDNLSSGNLENIKPHLKKGNVQLVEGDVRSREDINKAMMKVETVLHLAAVVSVPYSVEHPAVTHEVNAEGTRELLEASIARSMKRFVYVSSCAVYGEPRYLPIDENHPTNPRSPYAESKLRGEEYCNEFSETYGLKTVVLRLFNVYGPRQTFNEYTGVITRFINRLQEGRAPIIYGDGRQTRDFVHVSDVVTALLLSAINDRAAGQIFNIGSGVPTTISELCRIIMRKLNVLAEPVYNEPRIGDIRDSYAKIEKASRILGYKPKVSLDRGLEELSKKWRS